MSPVKVITVPAVPAPTAELCWARSVGMEHCDRRKGHGGLHIWELVTALNQLQAKQEQG